MRTIAECKTELEKGGSTTYRGWLEYLIRHFEKYGEQPAFEEVPYCDWLENGGGYGTELPCTKIMNCTVACAIISKDGTIYEYNRYGLTTYKILDPVAYERYKAPMPYNIYSFG